MLKFDVEPFFFFCFLQNLLTWPCSPHDQHVGSPLESCFSSLLASLFLEPLFSKALNHWSNFDLSDFTRVSSSLAIPVELPAQTDDDSVEKNSAATSIASASRLSKHQHTPYLTRFQWIQENLTRRGLPFQLQRPYQIVNGSHPQADARSSNLGRWKRVFVMHP